MKFYKTRTVKSPERAHGDDSGIDFFIPSGIAGEVLNKDWEKIKALIFEDPKTLKVIETFEIQGWENIKIPLWVQVMIPEGFDLQFINKSGIASKTGLILGASLVDNGYTWEIILNLINTNRNSVEIKSGMKIAQWVVRPVEYTKVEEVGELDFHAEVVKKDTERWNGWFGSTGI